MVTKLCAVTVFMLGVVMFMALGNENARAGKLLASGDFVTIDGHTLLVQWRKLKRIMGLISVFRMTFQLYMDQL